MVIVIASACISESTFDGGRSAITNNLSVAAAGRLTKRRVTARRGELEKLKWLSYKTRGHRRLINMCIRKYPWWRDAYRAPASAAKQNFAPRSDTGKPLVDFCFTILGNNTRCTAGCAHITPRGKAYIPLGLNFLARAGSLTYTRSWRTAGSLNPAPQSAWFHSKNLSGIRSCAMISSRVPHRECQKIVKGSIKIETEIIQFLVTPILETLLISVSKNIPKSLCAFLTSLV